MSDEASVPNITMQDELIGSQNPDEKIGDIVNSSNSNNINNESNNDSNNNDRSSIASGNDSNAQAMVEPDSENSLANNSISAPFSNTNDKATIATSKSKKRRTTRSKQTKQSKKKSPKIQQQKQHEEQPPHEFLCPITQQVMIYPLQTPYGQNFEGTAILEWLMMFSPRTTTTSANLPSGTALQSTTTTTTTTTTSCCPLTRQPLKTTDLKPNLKLQEKIAEWQMERKNPARDRNRNDKNKSQKEKGETDSDGSNDGDDVRLSLFPVVGKDPPRCPIFPSTRSEPLRLPERSTGRAFTMPTSSWSAAASHNESSAALQIVTSLPSIEYLMEPFPHPLVGPSTGPFSQPFASVASAGGPSGSGSNFDNPNNDNGTGSASATSSATSRAHNAFPDEIRAAISSIGQILLGDLDLPQLPLHYYSSGLSSTLPPSPSPFSPGPSPQEATGIRQETVATAATLEPTTASNTHLQRPSPQPSSMLPASLVGFPSRLSSNNTRSTALRAPPPTAHATTLPREQTILPISMAAMSRTPGSDDSSSSSSGKGKGGSYSSCSTPRENMTIEAPPSVGTMNPDNTDGTDESARRSSNSVVARLLKEACDSLMDSNIASSSSDNNNKTSTNTNNNNMRSKLR